MSKINIGKIVLQKLLTPLTNSMFSKYLDEEERQRLTDYQDFWNFYNGYHWERLAEDDRPETTTNWCSRFVNKYVATEFNSGFLFKLNPEVEEEVLPFLNGVWDDNDGSDLMSKVGQAKSVTGDAYVHVYFEEPGEVEDPFDIYPEGRIRLFNIPPNLVFPKYKDGYDDSYDALESVTIMYPLETAGVLGGVKEKVVRFVYTRDTIVKYINDEVEFVAENRYGVIPIVPFRNLPLVGSMFGQSDLRDLIKLNVEYNLKDSDVSQILDYNSAPTTIVQGAKPHNLEKGANRVWFVPEKSKVYNLELEGDLTASNTYIERVRDTIYNIGSMPKLAIGGETAQSNLSGISLQIAFMPLTDLVTQKRVQSAKSISYINKIILKIGVTEGLIDQVGKASEFYTSRIWWGDFLPKDKVSELNMVQSELKAGLTSREDAMTRLYKDNVQQLLKDIDTDAKEHPQFYGIQPLSMPLTNRLVNTYTGEEIVEAKPQEVEPTSNANPQVDLKRTVGRNREGVDKQVNAGYENFKPPVE